MDSVYISGVFAIGMATFTNFSAESAQDGVAIDILENEPSTELIAQIHDAFGKARIIKVSYIPRAKLGAYPILKERIVDGWEYQFSYRCPASCELRGASIQSYFSSGLKQAASCPGPYYAVLELLDRDDQVLVIYVDYTGRCFTVEDQSYHTPMNFDTFVEPEALYPDFAKP